MEDIDSSDAQIQQRQQQCEGQKRPGTPDHDGEKGSLETLGSLESEFREALQSYETYKGCRSFFVELGVGWTVDPTYAVGKRMTIYCPVEEQWHHCTTQSYCEDTGVHKIQFDDGKLVQLPLLAVKVRFLLTGGSSPKTPSLSRKKEVFDTVTRSMQSKKVYKKGYLPGIQNGLAKLQESMVHDAHFIAVSESPDKEEELEMARSILVGQEKMIEKYKRYKSKYLAMPHWMEDGTHLPGDLVWVQFKKWTEWPCIVVSSDQILEQASGKCTITQKQKHTCVYFLGTYEHVIIENSKVTNYADGLLKGYHRELPSTWKNSYLVGLEESKSYAKDGLIPSVLLEIFNKVNGGGQPNTIPLRKSKAYDSLDRSTFGFKNSFLLSNMEYNERSAKPSSSFREGTPTDSIINLGSFSVKGFQILSLGEIEWRNPAYHSKKYIWPAGYKVKRVVRSKYSEDKAVPHVVEIQPAIDRISEPIFKLTVLDTVQCEAKGSSQMFQSFLQSLQKNEGVVSFYNEEGVRFLGLNKPNVFKAILELPNAIRCTKLSPNIKKKIPERKAIKDLAGYGISILDEMKACQLPNGIEHVPMRLGRPFECQICCDIEEDEDDTIIQCDKCKNCVHMSCYSVLEAPNGRLWLCDVCQSHPKEHERPDCCLCPVKGGIMKRTTCGKWCHPICALWLPETSILRDLEYQHLRGLIDGIHSIHKSRMTSVCMFCKQKYGAVIQCCLEGSDCFRAFHFLCAKGQSCVHELVMDGDGEDEVIGVKEEQGKEEQDSAQPAKKKRKKATQKKEKKGIAVGNGGRLKVYCPKHSLKSTSKANTSSNNDSNSNLEIETHSFCDKNVAQWLENKPNIRKTYLQALALTPRAATPMNEKDQKRAVPVTPQFTCISAGTNLRSEVSKNSKTGITTTTVSFTNPEEKTLISVAENYNRLVNTWKKNIFPGKSAIHGWGAFTTKKLSRGDMVIEYVGELVRPSVAEMRERILYDKLVGAGTYVFRLNTNFCVDATRSGNLAHLLNHACSPNCASRTITVTHRDGATMDHVIIFALRDIEPGEELTYDYRFCGEEVLNCSCGSLECRGMVNQEVPAWLEPGWVPASMVKPINFDALQ